MGKYILAIDQSTQGTKALILELMYKKRSTEAGKMPLKRFCVNNGREKCDENKREDVNERCTVSICPGLEKAVIGSNPTIST